MQREFPHNTRVQVAEYLRTTLDVIEESAVPDDLRAAAFAQVFQAVAGKQIIIDQPQMGGVSLAGLRGH